MSEISKKDQKIIFEAKCNGTPIFVFTAKDALSIDAISEYYLQCKKNGCNSQHIEEIQERIKEFSDWQTQNPAKVKLPD